MSATKSDREETKADKQDMKSVLEAQRDSTKEAAWLEFRKAEAAYKKRIKDIEQAEENAREAEYEACEQVGKLEGRYEKSKSERDSSKDDLWSAKDDLEKKQRWFEDAQTALANAETTWKKRVEEYAAIKKEYDAATQACCDARSATEIAKSQGKADRAAAMVDLSTAEDTREDAIAQANTDYEKAADRSTRC